MSNQFTKSHRGSGLGLAITTSLAELHGGAIRIRSREGHGTIVSVRLPVDPAAEAQLDGGLERPTRRPSTLAGGVDRRAGAS